AQAEAYAALGCDYLHLVDLDGAKAGKPVNLKLLEQMATKSGMKVQIGGGIRQDAHIDALLDANVERVVIGSLAVKSPETVKTWFERYGSDRIVLALDVRLDENNDAIVATDAWTQSTGKTIERVIADYQSVGLKHVLCTDIGRDGAMSGPSISLYRRLLRKFPDIALQASGGVSSIEDLIALRDAGIPAAITGKALLEGKITAEQLSQC
ncbi:MAG: HisA/HisF-related TIM barrel protein, partial [Pseudomonadota bacterium]